MFYNTPNIDYTSNITTVFKSKYYQTVAKYKEEEDDSFTNVLSNDNCNNTFSSEELIEYLVADKEMERTYNNSLLERIVACSVVFKNAINVNLLGIAYIGPTEQVSNDEWQQMNEEGRCYLVNASLFRCFINRLNDKYNKILVEIDSNQDCPIYVYLNSFVIYCRTCHCNHVVTEENYYNVSILKVSNNNVVNNVTITNSSILAAGNVREINYLNNFNYAINEDSLVNIAKYKIIDEFKSNLILFNHNHELQLLNSIALMINQVRNVNWLYHLGIFISTDNKYGIIDNRGMVIWNATKFYNTFKELAILLNWKLVDVNVNDEGDKAIEMNHLLLKSNYNKLYGNSRIYSNNEEFFLCEIVFH